MRSYFDIVIHPDTGKWERAEFNDDAHYGVTFDDGAMFSADKVQRVDPVELFEEIERLTVDNKKLQRLLQAQIY